ncbi:MAG: hypothetical protein ABJA86_10005 [Nocardioidaceae bacterium]
MPNEWVATDACTLPSAEHPLRLAGFDDLFTTWTEGVDRRSATDVRLVLKGPADLFRQVQDLADRETACCAFFTFTLTSAPACDADAPYDERRLQLDIHVPAGHTDVLAALADRAEAAIRTGELR